MKHERTLEFNTSEHTIDEAISIAKEVVEEYSVFETEINESSSTHKTVESSGNKVSVMQMGSQIRVHIQGERKIVREVADALNARSGTSRTKVDPIEEVPPDETPEPKSDEELRESYEQTKRESDKISTTSYNTSNIQARMKLMEDGRIEIEKLDENGDVEQMDSIDTSAGLFIQNGDNLSIGEMYFDESFGMEYDTQHIEQLLNEIREAMLEEVR